MKTKCEQCGAMQDKKAGFCAVCGEYDSQYVECQYDQSGEVWRDELVEPLNRRKKGFRALSVCLSIVVLGLCCLWIYYKHVL